MKKTKANRPGVLNSRIFGKRASCPGRCPVCGAATEVLTLEEVEAGLTLEGLSLADVDPILGKKLKSGEVLFPTSSIKNNPAWVEVSPGCWIEEKKAGAAAEHNKPKPGAAT